MAHKNNILQELKDLGSVLATHDCQNVYEVPTGYFDGLEEKLMHGVRQSADFQTSQEELASLSSLLSGLKKELPYSVPEGYFENLGYEVATKVKTVATKVNTKTAAKVISIGTRRNWMRFAAAIVTGVIVLGGFFYLKKDVKPVDSGKAWAKVAQKVENLSDKELEEFVRLTDAGPSALSTQEIAKVLPEKTEELKDLLKDVSDTELQDFLDQTSNADESILMVN